MILALETATNMCSVAFCDDDGSVYERREEQQGSHSEKLFLFIEELQQEHAFSIPELDAVLVSGGPGSYTGLRISASAVKGLLFKTDVPLYAVNTLASFAIQAAEEHPQKTIHSVIDARRRHLYYQKFLYNNGTLDTMGEVEVAPIKEIEEMIEQDDIIIGTGLERLSKEIHGITETCGSKKITAKSLIRLYQDKHSAFFENVDPESFEPRYYSSSQVNDTSTK